MNNSTGALGNIFSRLQGLKNVSGRRITPGSEILKSLEPEEMEMEATAAPVPEKSTWDNIIDYVEGRENPYSRKENLPESDLGGQLTPQSYDIRANTVNNPEEEQNGFFGRLGKSLMDYVENREPSPESQQTMSPKEPETSTWENIQNYVEGRPNPYNRTEPNYNGPSSQEQVPGSNPSMWGKIVDYVNNKPPVPEPVPLEQHPIWNTNPQIPDKYDLQPPIETEQVDVQEGLPPVSASEEASIAEPPINETQAINETPKEEIKAPGTYADLGAARQVYEDPNTSPEVKSEIERIFDVRLTPERVKEVEEFEKAIKAYIDKLEGVETALDARTQALMSKVENRDLSTSEQISMALALIAPAIIGGLFAGKAGFVEGLAQGGKNIVGTLGGRQAEIKEAEKLIPELAAEKANIGKEKLKTTQESAELKRKTLESVPNHALRKLFTRDGMILNGKLVLDTGNPLIPLKSTAVRTEKDYDNFREKLMPKLAENISVTEQGLHLLDNLQSLLDAAEDHRKGILYDYVPFYDTIANTNKILYPAGRDTFKDENGNEVKISQLYGTVLEQLTDMYNKAVGDSAGKSSFKTYREHFMEMISNPFIFDALRKGNTQLGSVRAQINSVKDKFEDNIIKKLETNGVDSTPMKEIFGNTKISKGYSEKKRKNERANATANEIIGGK